MSYFQCCTHFQDLVFSCCTQTGVDTWGGIIRKCGLKNCNIIITCNVGGWPDGLNNLCNLKFVRVVDVTCWRERKVGIRMSLSARKDTIEVDRLL